MSRLGMIKHHSFHRICCQVNFALCVCVCFPHKTLFVFATFCFCVISIDILTWNHPVKSLHLNSSSARLPAALTPSASPQTAPFRCSETPCYANRTHLSPPGGKTKHTSLTTTSEADVKHFSSRPTHNQQITETPPPCVGAPKRKREVDGVISEVLIVSSVRLQPGSPTPAKG